MAYVESSTKLLKAQIRGAYSSQSHDLNHDLEYNPPPKYADYNRFDALEDSWKWFTPILPKDLAERETDFTGYLQLTGYEPGFTLIIMLDCLLKR